MKPLLLRAREMSPQQRRPAEPATRRSQRKVACVVQLSELQVSPEGGDGALQPRPRKAHLQQPRPRGGGAASAWSGGQELTTVSAARLPSSSHPFMHRSQRARSTPQISCLLSHLKCWAPLQAQWILQALGFRSFHTTSSLGIRSPGAWSLSPVSSYCCLLSTPSMSAPLEPFTKSREIWLLPPRD